MLKRKELKQLCKRYFEFLYEDHGFRLEGERSDSWGYELLLTNNTVGVILTFEYREFYLFVKLCRLRDGAFPPKPGEIRPETTLDSFDLDDIVSIMSPGTSIPPYELNTKLDLEFLEDVVKKQSDNLRRYGIDIVNGDFSIFPELDKIVKERARKAAIQKWGDKATDLGWII